MVSNARLALPAPQRPVTTMSLSRGISSVTFFKLCTRAPCTAMVVRAAALFRDVDKCQLLHHDVAPLRKLDGYRGLANEPLVCQILARRRHRSEEHTSELQS